jgi:hypothetical protein
MSSDILGSELCGLELASAESEAAEAKELFCVQMSSDILGSVVRTLDVHPRDVVRTLDVHPRDVVRTLDVHPSHVRAAEIPAMVIPYCIATKTACSQRAREAAAATRVKPNATILSGFVHEFRHHAVPSTTSPTAGSAELLDGLSAGVKVALMRLSPIS